jgi:hypothetical protein
MLYYPMPYLPCHLSYHRHWGIFIITNMIYIPWHISHIISYLSCHIIIPCHISWHIPHGISIITNMLYIPCRVSRVIPYLACHIIQFRISYAIFRTIFIMEYLSLPTIFVLPCHISHMSYYICHVTFSHVISPMNYITLSISCSIYFVIHLWYHMRLSYFLRYCLSCAIPCSIYHVIHRWCHIYGAIYVCIASKLSFHMVYLHLCCHISSVVCEGTASKIFQTCSISCAIYTVSSLLWYIAGAISLVTYVPLLSLRILWYISGATCASTESKVLSHMWDILCQYSCETFMLTRLWYHYLWVYCF